jgi:hypothetical protein
MSAVDLPNNSCSCAPTCASATSEPTNQAMIVTTMTSNGAIENAQ